MRIAVLGGGNGSFAAAGDMALAGHDVRLWRRDRTAVEAHNAAGSTIIVKDFRGRHEAKLSLVTHDIAAAVRDAELILCPAPATAHHDIARALAPHLADGQVVFLPPGTFGSYVFAKAKHDAGNEVASGAAGEVVVRGPNVFFEYWGNAAATAETLRDGWYHSGDIGTRDADGHFFIHDRKNNMIISGGENIYPAEVERVLVAHPEVAEGAVIGRADPKWQEVPVAYVVRRPNATCDARALEAHLLGQLARFKVPREYVFVDALPRNAMGKVQHFVLRELDSPLVPAKAGTQSQEKKELDSRLRGNERKSS